MPSSYWGEPDSRLWFEMDGCEGRHFLVDGNPHILGRAYAFCPVEQIVTRISKYEITASSADAERFLRGYLSGSEPAPPTDEEGCWSKTRPRWAPGSEESRWWCRVFGPLLRARCGHGLYVCRSPAPGGHRLASWLARLVGSGTYERRAGRASIQVIAAPSTSHAGRLAALPSSPRQGCHKGTAVAPQSVAYWGRSAAGIVTRHRPALRERRPQSTHLPTRPSGASFLAASREA